MASALQKAQTHDDRVHGSRKVKVTILASEWGPSNSELSTINRELAIQLAKFPELEITFFLPKCSQEDKNVALDHKVKIVEATPLSCFEQLDWLCFPPDDLEIDIVVGHGVKLGKQAQVIKKYKTCKWVQVVHTDPEERGMFKSSSCPISKGEEKHKNEVELCEMADHVVGVGPKLSEAFRSYLSGCNKDGNVFELTPGVFEEFETVKQVSRSDRQQRRVLVFGRGAVEDFELEGFDIAGEAIAGLQDTHLVFIGAPDGKHEEIAKRLMEYGVPASRLKVKGFDRDRESLKRLLQQADLVVMPSRTEGFGLTGLEAMSAGLPVLVSRNSGFGEALRSAAFGSAFVIESEDPTVWTAAIEKIWNKDRECRLEEAVNLRDSYGRKYNWAKQIKEFVDKMISLTHEDSPRARSSFETKCNAFLRIESMTDDHEEPSIEIENNQRTNSYHDEQLVSETSLPRSCDCVMKADAASGNPTKISTNTDSQSQNSRKRKMSEFSCDPDSVVIKALIEVLISWNTQDLTVAQQRILKEELEQSVHKYRRHQDLSSSPVDSSVARLTEYIEKAYEVAVMMVKSGSLIITVQCLTLESLESLWNGYCSGYLNDIVERFLVTDELKRKLGMDNVRLKTTIEEENYLICKKSFFENSENSLKARSSLESKSNASRWMESMTDHEVVESKDDGSDVLENHGSFIVNQITAQFKKLRKLRDELHDAFLRWIPIRTRTKQQLEELATKLHEHHRNVNISTKAGVSMGTIGGILSVAGLIAAPFTFGAGFVVTLVGAGIGGAGLLAMSVSKAVKMILEKLGLKEVQEAIEDDREACSELQKQLDSLENFIPSLAEFLKSLHDKAVLLRELEGSGFYEEIGASTEERVEFGARFFRAATSAATISASAAATAGAVPRIAAIAGTRVAHVAGSVISAALLPRDITLLVKSSLELHRGFTSAAAAVQDIRRILDELKCPDKEEIQGLVEGFIDEKFTEAYNKMDDDKEQEQNRDSDDSNDSDDR